jgi:hypothetical protein
MLRDEGVATAVEHMPCNCKALNSNPSTSKKRKRERQKPENARKKCQIIYKGKAIRIADFSTEILKARRHRMIYFKPRKKEIANLDYCT